jgi:hypothetical protein
VVGEVEKAAFLVLIPFFVKCQSIIECIVQAHSQDCELRKVHIFSHSIEKD